MFNVTKTAKTLVGLLRRNGMTVEVAHSGLSASQYITVSTAADTMRVRISDHVAKPTYEAINGIADYEVGNHDMAATESAIMAAAAIMDGMAVAYNKAALIAPIKAAETRKANQAAAFDSKMARRDEAVANWITKNAPDFNALKKAKQHEIKMAALKATINEWK